MRITPHRPRDMWSDSHHYLIWHGRNICKSRKPQCDKCPIEKLCEKNFDFLREKSLQEDQN